MKSLFNSHKLPAAGLWLFVLSLPLCINAQGSTGSHSLQNPVSGFGTLDDLFAALLYILIVVATPFVVFFLILAGFKYVTARGNPQTLQEASAALLYGVIGGVIIIGAVAILAIIKNVVAQF